MWRIKQSLVLLGLAGIVLATAAFWYRSATTMLGPPAFWSAPDRALALGRLAGLLAALAVLFQLLLIGRVKWIETAFGHDRLTRAHRLNAGPILPLLAAHIALVTFAYARLMDVPAATQFRDFLRNWEDVPAAVAATVLLLAVIMLSLGPARRRRRYETWHGIHLLAYAAVLLAVGHQFESGGDFSERHAFFGFWLALHAGVGLTVAWYRVARPLMLFARHRFTVDQVVPETDRVVSVYLSGRRLERLRAVPGQFMILLFWARGFPRQPHPFSLSAPPDGRRLRFTIKAVGDFTARVPELQPGTPVLVDGPHGVFTSRRATTSKVLLIAGGIGITPLRAMAGDLLALGGDVVLLYANARRRDILFADELAALEQGGRFRTHLVLSAEPGPDGQATRLDGALIHRWVPDAALRDVFLCGPPGMMKDLRRALVGLGVPHHRIHDERFALG